MALIIRLLACFLLALSLGLNIAEHYRLKGEPKSKAFCDFESIPVGDVDAFIACVADPYPKPNPDDVHERFKRDKVFEILKHKAVKDRDFGKVSTLLKRKVVDNWNYTEILEPFTHDNDDDFKYDELLKRFKRDRVGEWNYDKLLKLFKRDDIDDWNYDHLENRIAGYYVCPDMRALYTVFNSLAVWDAFQRGVWYLQHPNEERPRWSGLEYPHSIWLPDYHARQVDIGEAQGELFAFPLQPSALSEWPGITESPVSGPPGDHRVLFDEQGMFAGVAVIYRGEADGETLAWCYPILEHGERDVGATSEGNPGVDEAWFNNYDGHFLYAPDPAGGSRPPSPGLRLGE